MDQLPDADYVARTAPPGSIASYALLFAGAQRQALASLLALGAELRASSLGAQDHGVAHARLAWWQQELERLVAGRPSHPITRSLAAVAGASPPDWTPLADGLRGASLELARISFDDAAQLDDYLAVAIAPLHRMATTLALGPSPQATQFGARLGMALRLIEIIDRFSVDSRNGFIPMPLDWLSATGLTVEAVQQRRGGPELRGLLARLAAQADLHIGAALAALPREARRPLAGQLALGAGYTRRLAEWRRGGFDVCGAAPPQRPLATLWCCWRAVRRLDVEC